MNALLTTVTIRDLNTNLEAAKESFRTADKLVDERIATLTTAKRVAAMDPCDFTKARVQSALSEVEEAKADRNKAREDQRRAAEALRVFAYKAKPALTASGRALRH